MTTEISATDAARNFSDLLSRVRYAGESFLVVRNGEVMCRMEPANDGSRATVSEFLHFLQRVSSGDDTFADDLEKAQRKQPKLPRSPWGS